MLVSQNTPNLINGVSQQADALRYPSQCVEQVNFYPTILRGLAKRPPTQHVKVLTGGDYYSGYYGVHKIERSASERFQLLLANGAMKVFDLDGNEKTVTPVGSAMSYLACSDPIKSLRTLTVADYTFILNKEKTVSAGPVSPSNIRQPEAMAFVKLVRSGANFTIKLYDDPTSTTPDHTATITDVKIDPTITGYAGPYVADQGAVVQALMSQIAAGSANAVYDHFWEGPLMFFTKKDGSDFRIEVDCTIVEGMFAFKDSVQSFALLPKRGWVDFRIKVVGDPEQGSDDYYVKFVPQDSHVVPGTFAEGSWEETQASGQSDDVLDASTLPHALINHGTHFTFEALDWRSRTVGDSKSNPAPSFVGKTIKDVFFFKNRLGLLTGENQVLSCAGDFFNFWRTTVIQLLDGDVIDVAASATSKVAVLENAVSVSEKLLLMAEQAQFVARGGDLWTPKTVSIDGSTELPCVPHIQPRAVGNSVFFPFKRGEFTGFYEYAINTDTGLFDGFDITEHVPSYLKGDIQSFAASDTLNVMAAQMGTNTGLLYLYVFFKRGQQRIQSSWFKFQFDGLIRGYYFVNSRLYLVIIRNGQTCLEYLDLLPGLADTHAGEKVFVTNLDRRIVETDCARGYNPTDDETGFLFPYAVTPANVRIATRGANRGNSVPVKRVVGNTAYVQGNRSTDALYLGEVYMASQTMTRPALREQKQDGSTVINTGRFQVRYGILTVDETLDFKVEVTPKGRGPFTYAFSARQFNTPNALSDSPQVPRSVPFRFPVFSKNDQVVIRLINDSFLPSNLLSVDWEALYVTRAQRL